MSLNDIFASINSNVATVNSIVDSIHRITYMEINEKLEFAKSYTDGILWQDYTNIYDLKQRIYSALSYTLDSYEHMLSEYSATINSVRRAVDSSFSDYYDSITYQMESAITLTWNEIDRSIAVVNNRIDQINTNIESQIEDKIDESESWLTGLIDTLEEWTGIELNSVLETVSATATEIYGAIEEKAASIYNTVDRWIQDLWDYIVPFFEWVEEEFKAYYRAVRQWIIDKATEIYAVIETKVKELTDFFNEEVAAVWRQIIKVQLTLKTMIANLEATLRAWVTAGMNEIKTGLVALSVLTDWRFQFLNLFMSRPELSILQVLNRNDTLFQYYKPYWQAFFTRVMEPE